jgi:hypothetical protein
MSSVIPFQAGAALLVLLVGCSGPVVISQRSVILPQGNAHKLARTASGSWMPSFSDIAELEKRLPEFIAHHTYLHRSVADDYKQYVGIVRSGRRLVFVNAFSIPHDAAATPDWKREPIIWGGGGDTVWRVEFDPQQRTFEAFDINGPL